MDQFEIFEAFRKKDGGGTMIGAHISLEPILIQEYSEDFELVVIEIKVEGKGIRVISGYGPQETWSLDRRMPFFTALEDEVCKAELAGRAVMICCDPNSKMGEQYIPGDPHGMSENGKIIEGILERNALIVANGLKGICKGVITRAHSTTEGEGKSAIDLVLLSEDLVENVREVIIDEKKQFALESITKTKKGIDIKKSDHNTILTKFKFRWNKQIKKHRIVNFN